MTRLTYYRTVIALPVAAPIVFVALMLIPGVGTLFLVPGVLLGGSLIYGGPAYVPFAAVTLFYLRRHDAAAARRLALAAPVLVSPFVGLTVLLFDAAAVGLANRSWLREEFWGGFTLALLFGYAYVGVVLLGDHALFRGRAGQSSGSTRPSASR